MAVRRILYFTAEDHYLYRAAAGTLELEARFSGDDLGVSAFREHLRAHRGALYAVLADLAGEDFHEDQIPYLRGADRDAVVQRRLAQRYRDTRLVAALSLGPGDHRRAAQRAPAARLLHQHAAARALARRAGGGRHSPLRRLLGAAARPPRSPRSSARAKGAR